MTTRIRQASLVAGAAAAALLVAASAAWACTSLARFENRTLSPASAGAERSPRQLVNSGPAGTKLTVSGEAFREGAPVEVRWNAVDGALLATAEGHPSWTAEFRVPRAAPGVYSIVAVQHGGIIDSFGTSGNGSDRLVQRTIAFEVTRADGVRVAPTAAGADSPGLVSTGSDSGLAVGVGLLSIGVVTLLAASTAVVLGRRRAIPARRVID